MPTIDFPKPEKDARFSSRAWTGFYLQHWMPGRHKTDLDLTFANGQITGTGSDRAGAFTIDGEYEIDTGKCAWTKQYVGKHSVAYRGVNDGRGIWGVWEIRLLWGLYQDRGGFHIWPEGSDVSEESERTEEAVLAVMRQEFGNSNVLVNFMIFLAVLGIAAAILIPRFLGER